MTGLYTATSLVCAVLFTTVACVKAALPTAENLDLETLVGEPVGPINFDYDAQGNPGNAYILFAPDPSDMFHVEIIGNDTLTPSFIFTPHYLSMGNGAPVAPESFTFRVRVAGQTSLPATVTVFQKQYLCNPTNDCPENQPGDNPPPRWKTHYWKPRVWGDPISINDVTVAWENSALVIRSIGTVGDGGQRVAGFDELKFHPTARPHLDNTVYNMYTFNPACLTQSWPNQFAGPAGNACDAGHFTPTNMSSLMCTTAPLFSANGNWMLEYGLTTPCHYTWVHRFPFAFIMPGNPTTMTSADGSTIFNITLIPNGPVQITTTFYNSVIQPNHPDDESRGWADINTKFDITMEVETEVEVSISEDIISCDPHCERLPDGSLHCTDLCRRLTDECVSDPNTITTSVFSHTFSSTPTVSQSNIAPGSYTLEINIPASAATPAGTFDGTVVVEVCLCYHCTTYTRKINDKLTSYSLQGGFVGKVRTCRANPTVPNPIILADDVCAEVDALVYGPPDRATIFFDIVDVESHYVEPLSVSAKYTAWGITDTPTFRDSGFGDGTPGNGLTGQAEHFGYYEATTAVRSNVESMVGQSDFAFTVLPGVVNDNYKITFYVTLMVHNAMLTNIPATHPTPIPTNPFVPARRRFRALENTATAMKFNAGLNVRSNFNSAEMAAVKTQLGANGGTKYVQQSSGSSNTSKNSSDNSAMIVAAIVGACCVAGLLTVAIVFVSRKRKQAAALKRTQSDVKIAPANEETTEGQA